MKKRIPKILLATAIAGAFIISSCADKGMNETNYNIDTTKKPNHDTIIKDMNDSIR